MAIAQLDKVLDTTIAEGHGTVTIRVVVLDKGMAAKPAPLATAHAPVDAEPDEILPETDKRAVSTFLEEPKRGKQCCVFLVNGQRQHAWDNQFIVRDLELKYLRNRMIVVIDCDGLKHSAINELMRGHRLQFYEGSVYAAVEARVIATLKGDPDLRRLEEEAEDDAASLEAGNEAVRSALDRLIEAHHDLGPRNQAGQNQAGAESRLEGVLGALSQTQQVVFDSGEATPLATDPVLLLRPEIATIRLRPNETRRCVLHARPEPAWKDLETLVVTMDPPIKELLISRTNQVNSADLALTFAEPEDADEDEYPIETTLRATAIFRDFIEPRYLERRVVIMPRKTRPPGPKIPLKEEPTYIKVTSRQPIKIVVGGPDVHVKLKWDGKDELLKGDPPQWTIRASCEAPGVEPQTFITHPTEGRFELLIQAAPGIIPGEEIKFDIEAVGPGQTLATAFLATIVEPATPKKTPLKVPGGGQRHPPYDLKIVKRENWDNETCWGERWCGSDAGAFDEPTATAPLYLYINQDFDLLTTHRDFMTNKRLDESTIQQRVNKYTAHVAFHLYQMYQNKKQTATSGSDNGEIQTEEQMRLEIRRVGQTLLKLMGVMQ